MKCIEKNRAWLDPTPRPLHYTLHREGADKGWRRQEVWIQAPGVARWEKNSWNRRNGKLRRTAVFTPEWEHYLFIDKKGKLESSIPASHFRYLCMGITWDSGLFLLAEDPEAVEYCLVEELETDQGVIAVIEARWYFWWRPISVEMDLTNCWFDFQRQHVKWIQFGIRLDDYMPVFERGVYRNGNVNYRIEYGPEFHLVDNQKFPRRMVYDDPWVTSFEDKGKVEAEFKIVNGVWLLDTATRSVDGKFKAKIFTEKVETNEQDPELFDYRTIFEESFVPPRRIASLEPDEEVQVKCNSRFFHFRGPSPFTLQVTGGSDDEGTVHTMQMSLKEIRNIDKVLNFLRGRRRYMTSSHFSSYEVTWLNNGEIAHTEKFYNSSFGTSWTSLTEGLSLSDLAYLAAHPEDVSHEKEGHFLGGYVCNDLGEPLGGVEVCLYNEYYRPGIKRTDFSFIDYRTYTGKDGSFHLRSIEGERVRVVIDGLHDIGIQKFPDPEQFLHVDRKDLEIRIDRYASFQGKVFDTEGRQLKEFFVTPKKVKEWSGIHFHKFIKSGHYYPESGFSVEVEPGIWILEVCKKGHCTTRSEMFRLEPGQCMNDVEVTLQKTSTVKGVVVDAETHEPVAGARVHALLDPNDYPHSCTVRGDTGDDGSFELLETRPGKIYLTTLHEEYGPHRYGVLTVEEGEIFEGLKISLERGGKITGRVTAQEEGTKVELFRRGCWSSELSLNSLRMHTYAAINARSFPSTIAVTKRTEVGIDDTYNFDHLAPGTYELQTKPEGGQGARAGILISHDGRSTESCDILLGTASVRGMVRVVDAPCNRGLTIHLRPVGVVVPGEGAHFTPHCWTRPDKKGVYSLTGIHAGHYLLKATFYSSELGKFEETREIDVVDGILEADFEFILNASGEIRGTILENGNPVEGVTLHLENGEGDTFQTQCDKYGSFHFKNVPQSRIDLYAEYPFPYNQYKIYTSKVSLDLESQETVECDLSYSTGHGIIYGKVTGDEESIESAIIEIMGKPDSNTPGIFCSIKVRDGIYAIEDLPSGRYELVVNKSQNHRKVIRVADHQTVRVDFDLSN